ncbi:MAG: tRNA (adenosine(37)-N6)-dimethylallyltransferase MiaA [Aestuariivirga sp.]|uniref:tRNA (adenosine(37)-N6)-dimethylallyltransferase MiaA n=1 Tax=Aestuariivirga sp. TaxID=2650926 RepID=UPI0025C06B33|nr:tRNA (adenosine(37)-N6)-dimethylallyltransferase MiaA [Aestuariivirga sp.]MCA3562325.1 tRNA (adenosine(37)-N6)-dimethylallyltransferase MiaA [Aestuariivirga sp.]
MNAISQKRALLIAGPTASGKSALALEKAAALNGVIVNADALQIYAPLRILSARPTPEEEARAPHCLYGHVGAEQPYSVAIWLAEARRQMDAAWEQGLLPIITGGTGLYFRALEQGLAPVQEIPVEVRAKWRNYTGDLHAELSSRDRAMAAKLPPSDRQRLARALEVLDATGRSLLDWQREGQDQAPLAGVHVGRIFMDVPREELYARAEARFDAMMAAGALYEARALMNLDPMLPAMKAIGLPELIAHLRGELTLEESVTQAKTATRNFIKRQLTWWRGQMRHWR